jgi:integrase/recombinase XerD
MDALDSRIDRATPSRGPVSRTASAMPSASSRSAALPVCRYRVMSATTSVVRRPGRSGLVSGVASTAARAAVTSLWLGHAGTKATQIYLHADLAMKEKALARTAPLTGGTGRYRPGDSLLAFLEGL